MEKLPISSELFGASHPLQERQPLQDPIFNP